jgi:hypothetical protein
MASDLMRPKHRNALLAGAIGTIAWMIAPEALADMVGPWPRECPPGTTKTRAHGPGYCKPPPPTNCPPGYEGKVIRNTAFCEAPPPQPCPPGSRWETWELGEEGEWERGVCTALPHCNGSENNEQCLRYGEHATCQETSYCIRPDTAYRSKGEEVLGPCKADSDCGSFHCEKQNRCVSPDIQAHEAARIEAAKVLKPVPPPYSTEEVEGVPRAPTARTNTAPTTSDPPSESSTNRCACRMVGSDRNSGQGVVLLGWIYAWVIRRRACASYR